jgi:Eukaryotic protein of unknown function (DUF846)
VKQDCRSLAHGTANDDSHHQYRHPALRIVMMSGGLETLADGGPGSSFLTESLPAVQGGDGAEVGGALDGELGSANDRGSGVVHSILRESAHKTTATVHVVLKIAAVASYLLLGWFTSSFVIQFVVTVTLLAVDFWTVKNVAGRLLVGLRWWNEVGEDGTTQTWRFESLSDRSQLNVIDGRIFWWTMYANPLVWIVLGIACILKFSMSYLVIVAIALVLSAANLVGYYKCSKDATEQMKNYIGKTMLGQAMESSGLGSLSRFIP